MLNKNIKLIDKEALPVGKASLSIFRNKEDYTIIASLEDEEFKFTSSDYFNSLNLFRDYLYNERGFFPNLKGALKLVYPSRMSRQMSGGAMAYCFIMGKQADQKDLINIFDEVDESEYQNLVSVQEQLNCYKAWLKSL